MDSDWKYKRTPLTKEEAAYFYDIWGCAVRKNTEDVLIRQGTSGRKTMAPLRSLVALDGKDVPSAEGLAVLSGAFDRFPGCDLYFSPNTFRIPKRGVKPNARETGLFAVYAWALDIDYKKAYEARYDAALSSWTRQKEAELGAMKPQPPLLASLRQTGSSTGTSFALSMCWQNPSARPGRVGERCWSLSSASCSASPIC